MSTCNGIICIPQLRIDTFVAFFSRKYSTCNLFSHSIYSVTVTFTQCSITRAAAEKWEQIGLPLE